MLALWFPLARQVPAKRTTLATIFAGTYLGGGLLVNAYAVLRTPTQTLRQQLRDA